MTIRRRQRQGGFVLIIMTASAIAMVGALGLAVDMGRVFIIKNETQHFCDSAALAAALKLDGTSAGVISANSTATSLADNWNFGTTTVGSPTIEYATTSSGTWTNAPPNPPTNYIYVRVKSSVLVPMYFLPVVMTTKVYTQTVNSQAVAGQVPLTTLNVGLSPYAGIVQDITNSNLGLVKGNEYALHQANVNSGGPNCKQQTPDKCYNGAPGSLCANDTPAALWQVASIWGSTFAGYWGYTSNTLVRYAVLDLIQPKTIYACMPSAGETWANFETDVTSASCAANTNIAPSLTNGNKSQESTDLDTRVNQDTYRLEAQTGGNKNDPSGTLTNYQTALHNTPPTANGRRLLTAPIVWPVTAPANGGSGTTSVLGYGYFLLESSVTSGSGNSNYYGGHYINGNDAYCAIYAGPALVGGSNTGGSSSPGVYVVQLIS